MSRNSFGMKLILTIFFSCTVFVGLAQTTTSKKATYYCSPCGCELDNKILDSSGKCPRCNMRLIPTGSYNYESPVVSNNGLLVYSSNKSKNTKKIFISSLHSTNKSMSIGEGGLPRLSPNGSSILFERHDSIFVYDLKEKKSINLSNNIRLVKPQTPCWAANGKEIYFAAGEFPSTGIYKLNLTSGNIDSISTSAGLRYAPASSPDGKRIAYRCRIVRSENDIQRGIALYDLETNVEKFITSIGEYCTWSPDGKQLAFHWPDSSDFCIYTVNRDGSGLKRIAFTRGSDNELPTWSPDGKKIFFQTNRRRGNWEIWSMNVDGSDQKLVLADN